MATQVDSAASLRRHFGSAGGRRRLASGAVGPRQTPEEPAAKPMNEEGVGIEGPRARDARRYSHEAMHTVFEVYAVHPDRTVRGAGGAGRLRSHRPARARAEPLLANSDITRINHLAAGETTRVSPSTLECLVIARHVFDLTGGAFDVSIGTGLPSLELDADDFVVRATKGGRAHRSRRHR